MRATLPSAYSLESNALKMIRSLTVCRVNISAKHKISGCVHNILNDRSHVLYLPTRKRFQTILDGRYDEHHEGLWINLISNRMQKKKTVRSWGRRRVEQAVTEALSLRGFDRNGRRLLDRSESNDDKLDSMVEHAPEALVGTVDIYILPGSIETSFTEVQRQAGVVVDSILGICGRYPRTSSTIDGRNRKRYYPE